MGSKQEQLKSVLTDAIVELCRKEAFYAEELRIEGTVCLVSDRSSVLIAQITEQIGERFDSSGSDSNGQLPVLNTDQADEKLDIKHKHLDESGADLKRGILAVEYSHEMSPPSKHFKHSPPGGQNKGKPEGKFKCPFCTKRYRFRQSLKDHMNKHTGRKPHVCKYCSHTFMHFGSLCAHIKKQHFSQMPQEFQCGVCKDFFLNEQSLKQHFTWRHSDIPYVGPTRKTPMKQHKVGETKTATTGTEETSAPELNHSGPPSAPPAGPLSQQNHPLEGAMNLDQISQQIRKPKPDVADMVQTYMQLMDTSQTGHPPVPFGSSLLSNLPGLRPGPPPLHGLAGLSSAGLGGSAAAALGSLPGSVGGSASLGNQLTPLPPYPPFSQLSNPASASLAQLQLEMAARHMSLPLNLAPMTSLPEPTLPVMSSPPPVPVTSHPAMSSASNSNVTSSTGTPVAPSPSPSAIPPNSVSPKSSDSVTQKTDLDLEIQRTPDGKFRCPYCEKMYNFKHTLKDHINKHTGKRPYVCKHCGDSFTHLASLCAHIKRRHDAEITTDYQCEVCQEKFMNLQSLKQHYTWRHKELKFPIAKYEGPGLLELSTEISNADIQPTVFPQNGKPTRRGGSQWMQSSGANYNQQ